MIGAFLIAFMGSFAGIESLLTLTSSNILVPLLFILIGLEAFVLFLSTQHLGKPWRFYRGFYNLRHSPLSREALGVSIFLNCLIAVAVLSLFDHGFLSWFEADANLNYAKNILPWLDAAMIKTTTSVFITFAALAGLAGLYYMYTIYRIKARPFWNHWQVLTSFFGVMFNLGALLITLVCIPIMLINDVNTAGLLKILAGFIALGLALEGIGHIFHARDLKRNDGEGAASYYLLTTQYGKTYITRNIILGTCLTTSIMLAMIQTPEGWPGLLLWAVLAGTILLMSLVGRALFYVMVIPTTMPSAFFWRNKGFEEHARATGLAKLPQVGVLQTGH